jgi:DNA-binding IclR family transcriptional regulator
MSNEAATRLALQSGLCQPSAPTNLVGPRAMQTIDELLRELATTRTNGYGLAVEEAESGVKAIAIAVREPNSQRVLGTISIAGPLLRMGTERDSEFHILLQQASGTLGLVWPLETAPI